MRSPEEERDHNIQESMKGFNKRFSNLDEETFKKEALDYMLRTTLTREKFIAFLERVKKSAPTNNVDKSVSDTFVQLTEKMIGVL